MIYCAFSIIHLNYCQNCTVIIICHVYRMVMFLGNHPLRKRSLHFILNESRLRFNQVLSIFPFSTQITQHASSWGMLLLSLKKQSTPAQYFMESKVLPLAFTAKPCSKKRKYKFLDIANFASESKRKSEVNFIKPTRVCHQPTNQLILFADKKPDNQTTRQIFYKKIFTPVQPTKICCKFIPAFEKIWVIIKKSKYLYWRTSNVKGIKLHNPNMQLKS